jgi:hypothetical protein
MKANSKQTTTTHKQHNAKKKDYYAKAVAYADDVKAKLSKKDEL